MLLKVWNGRNYTSALLAEKCFYQMTQKAAFQKVYLCLSIFCFIRYECCTGSSGFSFQYRSLLLRLLVLLDPFRSFSDVKWKLISSSSELVLFLACQFRHGGTKFRRFPPRSSLLSDFCHLLPQRFSKAACLMLQNGGGKLELKIKSSTWLPAESYLYR